MERQMMQAMMERCMGDDGKPDFDKMKVMMASFMEHMDDDSLAEMKSLCCGDGPPDMAAMQAFMTKCCGPKAMAAGASEAHDEAAGESCCG